LLADVQTVLHQILSVTSAKSGC